MLKQVLWVFLLAYLFTETILLLLNSKNIRQNLGANIFRDFIDDETFCKATTYSLTRNTFSLLCLFYRVILLAFILKLDVVTLYLNHFPFTQQIWLQSLLLFLWNFLLNSCSMPLEYFSTFKIEKDYGFNRTTHLLWVSDQFKGFFVSACINIPIFALLFYILETCPKTWWIWSALGSFILQVFLLWIYPKLILPLFNKLTPLKEGSLKERLDSLAQKSGFTCAAIQILDSSKRSTHSNAYCSSLGKIQQVVLYDTLLKNFTDEEIEAIVAHEIGHYKCKHIFKMLMTSFLCSFIGFKVCDYILQSDWLANQLGVNYMSPLVLLVVLSTFLSLFSYWLNPLLNYFSRKYEYEADAFASKQSPYCGHQLVQALRKLYRENLSNLFPHPWYSCFHYSHPTLLERERAIYGKDHFSKDY